MQTSYFENPTLDEFADMSDAQRSAVLDRAFARAGLVARPARAPHYLAAVRESDVLARDQSAYKAKIRAVADELDELLKSPAPEGVDETAVRTCAASLRKASG